jgi:hypothetical protein
MRVDYSTQRRRFARIAIWIAAQARFRNVASRLAIILCAFLAALPAFAQSRPAAPAHSATRPGEIIAIEAAFQQFEVKGNIQELEKMMLPDFVQIEQEMMTRDQVLATVKRVQSSPCRVGPVKMIDPKVAFLSPEIATIVYRASQVGTCGSSTYTLYANISTVWVRRDGRWQMEIHAEYLDTAKAG